MLLFLGAEFCGSCWERTGFADIIRGDETQRRVSHKSELAYSWNRNSQAKVSSRFQMNTHQNILRNICPARFLPYPSCFRERNIEDWRFCLSFSEEMLLLLCSGVESLADTIRFAVM